MLSRNRFYVVLLACWMLAVHSSFGDEGSRIAELELSKKTYDAWREQIVPAESDLGWQEIAWLTTFQDGILDANQRELPLLFWTMNGHPLGCT